MVGNSRVAVAFREVQLNRVATGDLSRVPISARSQFDLSDNELIEFGKKMWDFNWNNPGASGMLHDEFAAYRWTRLYPYRSRIRKERIVIGAAATVAGGGAAYFVYSILKIIEAINVLRNLP